MKQIRSNNRTYYRMSRGELDQLIQLSLTRRQDHSAPAAISPALSIPDPKPVRLGGIIANPLGDQIVQQVQMTFGNLSDSAISEIKQAVATGTANERLAKALGVLQQYRPEIETLLAEAQLASQLAGMLQPGESISPSLIPPVSPPAGPFLNESFGELRFPLIENAVESLYNRNLLTPQQFHELADNARATAFTVAGIEEEATIGRIRDALAESVQQGASLPDFKRRMEGLLDEGTMLSRGHMETVFRTNVQAALSDGQQQILQHPMVRSAFPYVRYAAIHDDRARPEHIALETYGLNGTAYYRSDDPVIRKFRPPWDFNCRCTLIPATVRQAAAAGVIEAQHWLRSGQEPDLPQYVASPPFEPPPGFRRNVVSLSLLRMGWVKDTRMNPRGNKPYSPNRYVYQDDNTGVIDQTKVKYFKTPPKGRKAKQPAQQQVAPKQQQPTTSTTAPAQPPQPQQKPITPSPLPQGKQLSDKEKVILKARVDDARKSMNDPEHAFNKHRDKVSRVRLKGGAAIVTIKGGKDSGLTSKDHMDMVGAHTNSAQILAINGNDDLAAAHKAAADYHWEMHKWMKGKENSEQQQVKQSQGQGSATVQQEQKQEDQERKQEMDQFISPHLESLRRSKNIPEKQREYLKKEFTAALERIPSKAIRIMNKNGAVSDTKWSSNQVELFDSFVDIETEEWLKTQDPRDHDILRDAFKEKTKNSLGKYARGNVKGMYDVDKKRLHLNGEMSTGNPERDRRYGIRPARYNHAHELGHAIDFSASHDDSEHHRGEPSYSETEEWVTAWQEEIVRSEGANLTPYAASRKEEGFAEMARLLYTEDISPEEIQQKLPKCYEFFKKRGLI